MYMLQMQKRFGRLYYPYSIYVLNSVSESKCRLFVERTQNSACLL